MKWPCCGAGGPTSSPDTSLWASAWFCLALSEVLRLLKWQWKLCCGQSFFYGFPFLCTSEGVPGKAQQNMDALAQKEGGVYSWSVLSHLKQMVLFLVPDGMTFSSQKPFKFDHADMLGRTSDEHTSVQDLLPTSNMSTIKLTKGVLASTAGASAWLAFKDLLEKCSCRKHPGQCSLLPFHSMKFYILLIAFWNTLGGKKKKKQNCKLYKN